VIRDDEASPDRAAHEMRAAALDGRRILRVRYWDVHNLADDLPRWDYGDWHRAVMGVDLLTDAGPSCVLWTDTFYPYGVEVLPTPAADHVVSGEDGPWARDVSESDRWQPRLGTPVREVQTFWEHLTLFPADASGVQIASVREVDVPVALRVDFAAGPVWMVAGIPQQPEMREAFIPGDEIMVVFTSDRMRQIGFPDSDFLAGS
jgi:hypothetical protein